MLLDIPMKMVFQSFTVSLVIFFSFTSGTAINTCKFDVKLKQVLLNEGFHRNITYGIVFNSDDERERWLYNDCIVGVDQTLPAGVFVNPDELSDLRRTQRVNAVPKNKVNIEMPTEHSSASSVYVLSKVNKGKAYLWLPVHARYHKAVKGGGTARNEIGPPHLYLRCPDERLDMCDKAVSPSVSFLCNGSSREKCSWKEIPFTMMTDTLVWDVPVGNTDHYYVVASCTGLVVVVGALYILKTIHEYKVNAMKKKQY